MNNQSFFKKISFNPFIVKLVRIFRLRGILRKFYYECFCPDDGILSLKIGNIDAKFYVRTPDELRLAESVGGVKGEQKVINGLVSHLSAGDAVYDVGANIGVYSVILSKAVGENGKIFAFEPEKNSIVRLQENIKINNLKNIEIIDKALGEVNAEGRLHIGQTTGNFSLIKIYEKEDDSQDVEIINGDEYVKNHKLPIPTAIKVDVEGYEYSVLAGLKNTLSDSKCRIICCEIHMGLFPDGVTEAKILEFIKSLGFNNIDTFKRDFSAYHIIAQKQ